MAYRKFKADLLFTGREMAAEGSVLVIKEDGTVEAVLSAEEAGEGIETIPGLLTPGFVNCHCHLELSHMKGLLPEGTGMVDFLLAVVRGRGTGAENDLSVIRDAIAAFGDQKGEVALPSPATCQAIFMAIQKRLSIAQAPLQPRDRGHKASKATALQKLAELPG